MALDDKRKRGGEVAPRGNYEPTTPLELTKQIELLRERFNLPPTMIERYYVRLDGRWAILRKREAPIKIYDLDPAGHAQSVAASQMLPSERLYGRRREADDPRFFQPMSVTPHELIGG